MKIKYYSLFFNVVAINKTENRIAFWCEFYDERNDYNSYVTSIENKYVLEKNKHIHTDINNLPNGFNIVDDNVERILYSCKRRGDERNVNIISEYKDNAFWFSDDEPDWYYILDKNMIIPGTIDHTYINFDIIDRI